MSWLDLNEQQQKAGIDYDLIACLDNNPQQGFLSVDIDKVLAVWEGENDGDDWRWVLRLKDGRHVFLQGGCDYTGWDCQSWATSKFADSPEEAAKFALGDVEISAEQNPGNAGAGHLITMLFGSYGGNVQEVYESLLKQISEGKSETWSERTARDMGE